MSVRVPEARDESLSAELTRLWQQQEAASVQVAASQQAAVEQLRDLHTWAHTSLDVMQARYRAPGCPGPVITVHIMRAAWTTSQIASSWQVLPILNKKRASPVQALLRYQL